MNAGNAELEALWKLFPSSALNNDEANSLLLTEFRNHTAEVVRAVIRSHKKDRKYNDPCVHTIVTMLAAARNQMIRETTDTHQNEDNSVRAMRAWAIKRIGAQCEHWDGRAIVEARIRAEWDGIHISIRPKYGEEMNFGPWLGMIAAAGGNTEAGRRFLEDLTGCRDISKYDGLDNRQMYAAFQAAMADAPVRDAKKDVEEFRAWQDRMRGDKHKLRRAVAEHKQATKLLPGNGGGQ